MTDWYFIRVMVQLLVGLAGAYLLMAGALTYPNTPMVVWLFSAAMILIGIGAVLEYLRKGTDPTPEGISTGKEK